jgi:hypothetical protein
MMNKFKHFENISSYQNNFETEILSYKMYEVYQYKKYASKGNAHAVGREETWELLRASVHETEEEAKDVVRDANSTAPDYLLYTPSMSAERKQTFLEEFCFDDKWAHKRRYCLGKPDTALVQRMLESDGIRIAK